jgi:hypothetical protein
LQKTRRKGNLPAFPACFQFKKPLLHFMSNISVPAWQGKAFEENPLEIRKGDFLS